ncbi:MAG: LolA family protein [Solirubrobacteraceae bacterium]
MRYLRTVSTRRLLALLAGVVTAIAAGAAIAVAASGSGPVPPGGPKPLAAALHNALSARSVQGISARIKFTNNLIDASNLQGTDPLLQGASGRLWWSAGHGLRLELQSDNGDAQLVVNHASFWVYDPSSKTVYEGRLPAGKAKSVASRHVATDKIPSVAAIQTELTKLAAHLNISRALPTDVSGQPTYTVRVSPRHDAGLLGAAEMAWDSVHGIPLRFAIYARGETNPVLELAATQVSYGAMPVSDLAISPPRGAKVVKVSTPGSRSAADRGKARTAGLHGKRAGHGAHGRHVAVNGVSAVAAKLPFALVAPNSLDGLPRRSSTLLDWGGSPAALVSFGQNLGGIAVIEQMATSAERSKPGGSAAGTSIAPGAGSGDTHGSGLSLPTVSINGITGQELDTALGTLVRFTRRGVTYTVLGSVPAYAAEKAARAL